MNCFKFFLLACFATVTAQAGQGACKQLVVDEVSERLDEGMQITSISEQIEFEKYTVYLVNVGLKIDINDIGPGVPAKSTYNVLVEKYLNVPAWKASFTAECSILDAIKISEVN